MSGFFCNYYLHTLQQLKKLTKTIKLIYNPNYVNYILGRCDMDRTEFKAMPSGREAAKDDFKPKSNWLKRVLDRSGKMLEKGIIAMRKSVIGDGIYVNGTHVFMDKDGRVCHGYQPNKDNTLFPPPGYKGR